MDYSGRVWWGAGMGWKEKYRDIIDNLSISTICKVLFSLSH